MLLTVVGALLYLGLAIIVGTVASEGLSIWALDAQSNNSTILTLVLVSTLGLLAIMAVPAIVRLMSAAASRPQSENRQVNGIRRLRAANRDEMARRPAQATPGEQQIEAQRRNDLNNQACQRLGEIARALRQTLHKAAPLAEINDAVDIGWTISLNNAHIKLSSPIMVEVNPWESGWRPPFDVISASSVCITAKKNRYGYKGRSHSLWYCDARRKGHYDWYEVAFVPQYCNR